MDHDKIERVKSFLQGVERIGCGDINDVNHKNKLIELGNKYINYPFEGNYKELIKHVDEYLEK